MSKFSDYKLDNKVFFETGTWQGDGIQNAHSAGFHTIYSCDIDEELIENAKFKFSYIHDLHLINQDSRLAISENIDKIESQCLFFLDAHIMPKDPKVEWSWGQRQYELNLENITCPLIEEINSISLSDIKTHSILIDDFQCFGTWMFNFFSFEECKNLILEINQNYKYKIINNSQVFFWI